MKILVKFRPSSHSDDSTTFYRQTMRIEVDVPPGTTRSNSPLVLSSKELELVLTLIQLCGEPKVKNKDGKQAWLFRYSGEEVMYRPPLNGCEPLLFVKGREYAINTKLRVPRCTETQEDINGEVEDTYL